MLEMPEAAPTSSAATAAVEAEDAGPLDRPSPTATPINGSTNAPYSQEDFAKARAPRLTAAIRKPSPTAWREPMRAARDEISGVIAIIAAAAGSVARPAWRAL